MVYSRRNRLPIYLFRREVVMDATLLFPLPEGMRIEDIQATETSLSLTVRATHPTSRCPLCSQASSSVHSHYQRTLSDASCVGRQVQLTLTVRRFYCRNRRMSSAKSLPSVSHALSDRGRRSVKTLRSTSADCGSRTGERSGKAAPGVRHKRHH